jgi:acetyl esterase/lipase
MTDAGSSAQPDGTTSTSTSWSSGSAGRRDRPHRRPGVLLGDSGYHHDYDHHEYATCCASAAHPDRPPRCSFPRPGVRSTVMTAPTPIVLEPAARQVVEAFANPPFLYEMAPAEARTILEQAQSNPVSLLPIDEEWITVPARVGDARVRLIKPPGVTGMLPVIVYMHGGGWILGNAGTHDRLVRELAVGARAALAFVEYPNSPEAHYPTAIEQGYATAQWITRDGASKGLDASRMAVAGESVGGNMTAALALMAKERGDVTFVQQSMYYPVTDAAMNTASYEQFATGYYLTRKAMQWFWDAYTTDPGQRAEITASPNQASVEQVAGLPPTYLCVDEADVLRDEGEAYAAKLRSAGVPVTTVRYNGTIHDFMLLNALSETRATRAAIDQATAFLRAGLGTD